jgi:hypothetical protein
MGVLIDDSAMVICTTSLTWTRLLVSPCVVITHGALLNPALTRRCPE